MNIGSVLMKGAWGIVLLIEIAGCATPPLPAKVSDVVANKIGYLTENFSPQSLDPGIRSQIPKDRSTVKGFHQIDIKLSSVYEGGDGRKETPAISATYVNAGDGLVQEMLEYSGNDIPYALYYSLKYANLLPLKSEDINMKESYANGIYEIKKLSPFSENSDNPQENGDYTFEYESSYKYQRGNFSLHKIHCHADKYYPANSLHPRLAGQAINLSCERQYKGVMWGKITYGYLQQYGIAVVLAESRSSYKMTARIVDVSIN